MPQPAIAAAQPAARQERDSGLTRRAPPSVIRGPAARPAPPSMPAATPSRTKTLPEITAAIFNANDKAAGPPVINLACPRRRSSRCDSQRGSDVDWPTEREFGRMNLLSCRYEMALTWRYSRHRLKQGGPISAVDADDLVDVPAASNEFVLAADRDNHGRAMPALQAYELASIGAAVDIAMPAKQLRYSGAHPFPRPVPIILVCSPYAGC